LRAAWLSSVCQFSDSTPVISEGRKKWTPIYLQHASLLIVTCAVSNRRIFWPIGAVFTSRPYELVHARCPSSHRSALYYRCCSWPSSPFSLYTNCVRAPAHRLHRRSTGKTFFLHIIPHTIFAQWLLVNLRLRHPPRVWRQQYCLPSERTFHHLQHTFFTKSHSHSSLFCF
jgi:hypothetical protein